MGNILSFGFRDSLYWIIILALVTEIYFPEAFPISRELYRLVKCECTICPRDVLCCH